MPDMNNNNNNNSPNSFQPHGVRFLNEQPTQNFHPSHSQLPYANSPQHPMVAYGEGLGPSGHVPYFNAMPSGGHADWNVQRTNLPYADSLPRPVFPYGIGPSGHVPYLNPMPSGGSAARNVQRPNVSSDAMFAKGLMPRQNAVLCHPLHGFSLENEYLPALPGFRGSNMDHPAGMRHNRQLHDYTTSQLHPQHLPGGPFPGSPTTDPNLVNHQQQLPTAKSGAGVNILQGNNENHPRSHVSNLRPSTLPTPTYHTTPSNMGLAAGGMKPLNPAAPQYEPRRQSQSQMQAAGALKVEDHTPKQSPEQPINPYGMLGLLHLLKPSQPTPSSHHSVGIDLTTLGLNVTQSDDLHSNFLSPFSENSVKDVLDRQFIVPKCYNDKQLPDLKPSWLRSFRLGMLFYIFYSMPKDVAQLYAAHELMNRGWLYHKERKLWLLGDNKKGLLAKTDKHERGAFDIFDVDEWKIINQENFVLEYASIENRPVLPTET